MYRTGGGQNEIVASEIDYRIADAFAKEIYPLNNTKDSDSNFHGKDVILIDPVDKDNDINDKPKMPATKQKANAKSNTSPAPKRIKVEMDNNYQVQMLENAMKAKQLVEMQIQTEVMRQEIEVVKLNYWRNISSKYSNQTSQSPNAFIQGLNEYTNL